MKKVFVILLIICLFILPSCKEELPGAKINIINETGKSPDNYELEILFDDSRTTNTRAFHMKNIGSEIVTGARSIVLENMPKTVYMAEVYAYDENGKKIGYGTQSFQASYSADVTIVVKEMPHAFFTKSFAFTKGTVDRITLSVADDSGEVIDSAEFTGLEERNAFTPEARKIRVDNVNANFTWTLYKESSVVETYTDRIENIENQRRYELDKEEINLGLTITDKTYESHGFDSITVSVEPIPELRSRISKLSFEATNLRTNKTTSIERPLRDDNLYVINECGKDDYRIKVTPIMNDGETLLESISATTKAVTNIPLESVKFVNVSKDKPIELKLGVDTLTFDIEKNPEDYTKWSEPGKIESSLDIVDVKMEGGKVTITPKKVSSEPTTLTYTEPHQKFAGDSINVNVALHPTEIFHPDRPDGSNLKICWDFIAPNSTVVLHSIMEKTISEISPEEQDSYGEFEKDISEEIANGYTETELRKNSKGTYWLEIGYPGSEGTIETNRLEYSTGEDNIIYIVLPKIEDLDFQFVPSMNYDRILNWNDEVTFTVNTIQNRNIRKVSWIVNNKLMQETSFTDSKDRDTFVFSAEDLNIDINYGNGVIPQEVVIAVEDMDGNIYSKNITLNLNMESRHD